MSHIAITNMVGGKNVDWMEQVSDDSNTASERWFGCGQSQRSSLPMKREAVTEEIPPHARLVLGRVAIRA